MSFLRLLRPIFLLCIFCFSAVSFAGPGLWQIKKNNHTSYLFGTIHVGDSSMSALPDSVIEALEKSNAVVVELDTTTLTPEYLQTHIYPLMTLPNSTSLSQRLKPELYQKLAKALLENGLSITQFEHIKPWAISINLTAMSYQRAGYLSSFGADMQVLGFAKKKQLEIIELESAKEQFGFFDQIDQDSNYLLSETLKSMEDAATYIHPLVSAWKAGDINKLTDYYHLSFDGSPLSQAAEKVILKDRNARWTTTLVPLLEKRSLFIAVGALHLPTEHGLIALFKKNGFEIKKIN
ncbi:TraB/GumN family protein [Pseudoalteromonas xiamenensis]